MTMHSVVAFFQASSVRQFGAGSTAAVAGAFVLILALGASGCNCDSATGPSGNQTTGGTNGGQVLGSSDAIVKGKVFGPDGSSPIVGASVTTSSGAFPSNTQKTDEDGEYWSDLPQAGTVTLTISASGYANASRNVTAVAAYSTHADFTLLRQ
jgi:hypothetical protein